MKNLLLLVLLFGSAACFAQSDSLTLRPLTISGYAEVYYLYDFDLPEDHNRPGFVYSYNRHNEVNLNLAFLKAAYAKDRVRGNLALMAGTYANANLAAEPGVLRNLFEANAGVKLSKNRELWLDAGLFTAHIGFESAIGKDCWAMTRSMLADNSPYYESGAKVSYTSPGGKWFISGLLLNGWQRIQRVAGNQTPAFGHQITYKPNARLTLNSSSFVGNDFSDSDRRMRYFHNFYGIFQVSDAFGLTLGFDIGTQEKSRHNSARSTWYAPILIARYTPSGRLALAARAEYYADKDGVIIATGTPNGFATTGLSFNVDYHVADNVVWRTEFRYFISRDAIFIRDGIARYNNTTLATALAISF